ncbi:MAG: hypothetical protein JKY02_06900, partial [Flavobacteriaceae bacterium]|nr:hypothetical protein [Flavobacteriaceae bacterium]
MIILIIAAVIVAFVLAYLIVKYLPLKLRWIASIVFLALTALLIYKIYDGVMKPINFNKNKKVKYAKVIKNLKIIRDAEIAYKEVNGQYTKDKALLIRFIDTAQRAIVETRDTVVKVNKGSKWQPVMIDVEKRIKDTIGYESILKDFEDRDYKNMFKVPGVDGKEFELQTGSIEKLAGLEVPVFEARTEKEPILKGMDISLVKQEKEAIATDQIKGEYVSVGSLNEITTGGNWPPLYDKLDRAK